MGIYARLNTTRYVNIEQLVCHQDKRMSCQNIVTHNSGAVLQNCSSGAPDIYIVLLIYRFVIGMVFNFKVSKTQEHPMELFWKIPILWTLSSGPAKSAE